MAYKLILVDTGNDYCECDGGECYCEPNINVQEISGLAELITLSQRDWQLKQSIASLVTQAMEDGDETLMNALRAKGWVNLKEIKDREDKLAAGKKYFYADSRRNAYGTRLQEVNLGNISQHAIRALASEDVHIVQSINKASLKKTFDAKQKKIYDTELARIKKEKEKKAEANRKRQETKKRKEIEKAKKILAAAEESNGK